MLCIMGIQSSTDIILWTVIHYTELLDSAFFKCINISDVNIEKIFEILGIQLIKCRYYFDGIFIIQSLRYNLFSNI